MTAFLQPHLLIVPLPMSLWGPFSFKPPQSFTLRHDDKKKKKFSSCKGPDTVFLENAHDHKYHTPPPLKTSFWSMGLRNLQEASNVSVTLGVGFIS